MVSEVLAEHLPAVYRFALRLTGDRHAAEDLAQETLLRGLRNRAALHEVGAGRVWLLRIAVRCWQDQLRRRRVAENDLQKRAWNSAAGAPAAEVIIGRQEDLQHALAALDRLPARQREALHLHAVEGLSFSEVADVLGVSVEAVRASVSIGRSKLREELDVDALRKRVCKRENAT